MTQYTVSSGQVSSGSSISNGDSLIVLSGGTASAAIVSSGGLLDVLEGGLAVGTVLTSDAKLSDNIFAGIQVESGASLLSTTVLGGLLVEYGGLVSGLVLSGVSAGVLLSELSGTAADVTVGSGGVFRNYNGLASSVTVLSGGLLQTQGSAQQVTVQGGGTATLSGGSLSGATLQSGGVLQVVGGSAAGVDVGSGALLVLSAGNVSGVSLETGGAVLVEGGALGGLTGDASHVFSSGNVLRQGTALTQVAGSLSGYAPGSGELVTLSGGTVRGTVIGAGVQETIAGGTALGDVVASGGVELAVSGTVSGTTVLAGGLQSVGAGATVTGSVLSGGTQLVFGSAVGTVVGSGGLLSGVPGYGQISGAVINGGGVAKGDFTGSVINVGGVQYAQNAIGTTISSGGTQILNNADVSATTVLSGGHDVVSGIATISDETVSSGGILSIETPDNPFALADVSGLVVSSGGILVVNAFSFDARQAATGVVQAGAFLLSAAGAISGNVTVSGTTTSQTSLHGITVQAGVGLGYGDTAILGGGSLTIGNGAAGTFLTVSSGALLTVLSGGLAVGTVLTSDAKLSDNIFAGIQVESGASLLSTTVLGGLLVEYGGLVSGLVLSGVSAGVLLSELSGSAADVTVGSGGVFRNYNGLASSVTVLSGGVLQTQGSAQQVTVQGGGTATLSGGSLSGATLQSGGVLQVVGGSAAGVDVGSGALLVLSAGNVSDTALAIGGGLDLSSFSYSTSDTVTFDSTTDTLALTATGRSYTQHLAGDYSGHYFHLAADASGGTLVTQDTNPACYVRGTHILTTRGECPVEQLRIGDLILTAGGRVRPIRWIGRRSYAGRFLQANPGVQPVRIRAGALGGALPHRDLLISPNHALLLDGFLVPARFLVDGHQIAVEPGLQRVDYLHIELDSHDVLLAEGAAAESFLDDDSRAVFHNASEFRSTYPDVRPSGHFCAQRLESGHALEAIRRRLATVEPTSGRAPTHRRRRVVA